MPATPSNDRSSAGRGGTTRLKCPRCPRRFWGVERTSEHVEAVHGGER